MKKYIIIIVIIVLVIGAAGVIVLFPQIFQHRRSTSEGQLQQLQASLIKTAHPQLRDFREVIHFIGSTESKNKVTLTALQAGTVLTVEAEDESFVNQDTLLFTLGGAMLDERRAILDKKQASLQRRVSLQTKLVMRKQQAIASKLVLKDELSRSQTDLDQLKLQLAETDYQIKLLQETRTVRAPVSGVFSRRKVSPGQTVMEGTVLAEIIVPNQVRVIATLFSPPAISLPGRKAILHTDRGNTITGTITTVLPRKSISGGILVWIEGESINHMITPGQVVSGDIILATHQQSMALPKSAIVRDEQEKTYIFIYRKGAYQKQPVETALQDNGWTEIAGGIRLGDLVVVQGAYELFYRNFNQIFKVED